MVRKLDAYWRAANYDNPLLKKPLRRDHIKPRLLGHWGTTRMSSTSRPGHLKLLEKWLKSYRPHELFDTTGRLIPDLLAMAPTGERRMSANPHASGGLLLRDLRLPDFRGCAVSVPQPGAVNAEATRAQGVFIRDVTITPFDMVVLNDLDRSHLVSVVIDRVPGLGARAAYAQQASREKLIEHKQYIAQYGDDMPDIRDWSPAAAEKRRRRSVAGPRRKRA